MDAQIVSNYFQALGGLPASNIRLLQDWKALRSDIDEALLDWLPPHMNKDAVVIVYFAGLASVSSTGETFLVPYDGTATTTSRAYPTQGFGGSAVSLESETDSVSVRWHCVSVWDRITEPRPPCSSNGIPREARLSMSSGSAASGRVWRTTSIGMACSPIILLLRALRGEADTNRDGDVTLGETVTYLSQKVRWASKTRMNQEQRPFTVPAIRPTDPSAALILTKQAAIQGPKPISRDAEKFLVKRESLHVKGFEGRALDSPMFHLF